MRHFASSVAVSLIGLLAACEMPPVAPVEAVAPITKQSTELPQISAEPQQEVQGEAVFITGGFDDEEHAMIQATKDQYNLHVQNTNTGGEFVGDTQVIIRNAAGEVVLDTVAGPLLSVQLADGTYSLVATHGGEEKTQKITLNAKKKLGTITLRWKEILAAE